MKKTITEAEKLGLGINIPVELIRRRRQKYMRIRVKPDCIQVSAPHRVRLADMKAYVREKSSWVQEQWQKLNYRDQELRASVKAYDNQMLWFGEWKPIHKKQDDGMGETVAVLRMLENGFQFIHSQDQMLTTEMKVAFYRRHAKPWLTQRTRDIANQHDFDVHRIYVRDQKTKWGSCSSKSNISLNWRLILCPEPVIDYLIIHECCHLVHMNHSKKFWNLVAQYCPDYQQHDFWLKENEPFLFRLP
jgi:predicted metal-dependent hydrolase